MSNENFDENQLIPLGRPLTLTPQQQQVLKVLKNMETKEWPLSKWYYGALRVLGDDHNPDRLAQAANSLREVMKKLSEIEIGYRKKEEKLSRKEEIRRELQKDDPMFDFLPHNAQQQRQKMGEKIEEIWGRLNKYVHHEKVKEKMGFDEYLRTLEEVILDLDIGANQREIEEILKLKPSVREKKHEDRMLSLIESNGASYIFFFKCVADPTWLPVLVGKGYLQSPPKVLFWPELEYLQRILDGASEETAKKVVELVLELPKVENSFVGHDILNIVLKLNGKQSERLKEKVFQYVKLDYPFIPSKHADILAHWTQEGQFSAALDLSEILVKFSEDPESQDKQDPFGPKPRPRFDECDYEQILNKGIRPLAESKPYEVSRILIDAVDNMVELGKRWQNDGARLWSTRIDGKGVYRYRYAQRALIHTLTFACEKVYEKAPDSIVALDEVLRKRRWEVFERLRHHLYARYPNEQTKPWIRDLILSHEDYGQCRHSVEFQQMIRRACEHFGEGLLTKQQRIQIFQAICSGPPQDSLQGPEASQDGLEKRFHLLQLKPFESVLCDEYVDYFRELEAEADEEITDEDYYRISVRGGRVTERSPKSSEELVHLEDKDLLDYINDWQEEKKWSDCIKEDDKSIEITIGALAKAFQSVFRESIIPDADRFGFWMGNKERIERPIYVRVMIEEMREQIKAKNFDRLDGLAGFL